VNLRMAALSAVLVLTLAGAIVFQLAVLAVWPDHPCSSDTVARATSPSGRVEALLDENNCGATTSFEYVVSLRAVASPATARVRVASAYGAGRNDSAYGMNLVWIDESTLEVQYWKAHWVTMEHPSVSLDGATVTTRMKADVRDGSAPAGGMLVNSRRQSGAGGAK
jgi:hypothetical protein